MNNTNVYGQVDWGIANDIDWGVPEKAVQEGPIRTYDVRITINSNSDKGQPQFRFGFINKAAEVFHGGRYIQMSSPINSNRIYFREYEQAQRRSVATKIQFNSSGDKGCLYTAITKRGDWEKVLRRKWVNVPLMLQYDEIHQLYYVEINPKEVE